MNTFRTSVATATVFFLFTAGHATAAILHLWDFEAGAELVDSAGGLNLGYAPGEGSAGGVMGTPGDVSFEAGYGGVGQAYRPY